MGGARCTHARRGLCVVCLCVVRLTRRRRGVSRPPAGARAVRAPARRSSAARAARAPRASRLSAECPASAARAHQQSREARGLWRCVSDRRAGGPHRTACAAHRSALRSTPNRASTRTRVLRTCNKAFDL